MTRLLDSIKKFLKLDGVQIIGNGIYFCPTNSILRGYFFERTSKKNEYYLQEMVLPLFSPFIVGIHFGYSRRLNFTNNIHDTLNMSNENIPRIVKDLIQPLVSSKNEYLLNMDDPAFFYRSFSKEKGQRLTNDFDLATSLFMAGERSDAIKWMREIYLDVRVPSNHIIKERIKPFYESTNQNEEAIKTLIVNLVHENVNNYFPQLVMSLKLGLKL